MLLPTPTAADGDRTSLAMVRGNPTLLGAVTPLPSASAGVPTPRATDGTKGGPNQRGSSGDLMLPSAVHTDWGQFMAAIARWEQAVGRPAPKPKDARDRLSPAFVEWMQGLQPGWVTDVPGLSRNDCFRLLGNGVVPQQGAEALRILGQRLAAP